MKAHIEADGNISIHMTGEEAEGLYGDMESVDIRGLDFLADFDAALTGALEELDTDSGGDVYGGAL